MAGFFGIFGSEREQPHPQPGIIDSAVSAIQQAGQAIASGNAQATELQFQEEKKAPYTGLIDTLTRASDNGQGTGRITNDPTIGMETGEQTFASFKLGNQGMDV